MASLWRLRHFLQIAESFYSLDNQGTGTINLKDCKCCGFWSDFAGSDFHFYGNKSNSWIHIAGANVARSCSWLHVRLAFPKSLLKWQGLLWQLVESMVVLCCQLYTNHFSSDVIFAGLSLAGRISQCHWHLFVQEGKWERESSRNQVAVWKLQVWRILTWNVRDHSDLGYLESKWCPDARNHRPRVFEKIWASQVGGDPGRGGWGSLPGGFEFGPVKQHVPHIPLSEGWKRWKL